MRNSADMHVDRRMYYSFWRRAYAITSEERHVTSKVGGVFLFRSTALCQSDIQFHTRLIFEYGMVAATSESCDVPICRR